MAATGDPELVRAPSGQAVPVNADAAGNVLTADRDTAKALYELMIANLAEQRESRKVLCKMAGELFTDLSTTTNMLGN